ncbi:MAG: M67 family metallopeptidase [Acidobacteria bacterium]|nr:M67 family metallopeptidase [Acidobacteriota bacterium]
MLTLSNDLCDTMVATCIRALPDEGCGLLLGKSQGPDAVVTEIVASENMAHSAKVYEIDSRVLLRAFRRADDEALDVLGVFHSHTHSPAYPSPTDVNQAPDPSWHYVLVSLKEVPTVVRSYKIVNGDVLEEEVGEASHTVGGDNE